MILPAMQLMVLSDPSTVDIVVANTHATASMDVSGTLVEKKMSISSNSLEELMDGVVDARIMETYVVVFKTRSIEVHSLVADITSSTDAFHCTTNYGVRDDFPLVSVSFQSVSISDHIVDQGTISFSFCGYDFLRGIFRFEVRVVLNQDSGRGPLLDLNCVGIYPMSDRIDKESLLLFSARNIPSSLHAGLPYNSVTTNSIPSSVSARLRSNTGHTFVGLGANSRGFVSAMSLGPQGKRAVWVERRRTSTIREVVVWQKREVETEVVIPRQAVYWIESYDLREDLTHCAIGEVSGTIVLGNRAGHIFILGLDL
ncbi:hypothetical protein C0995_006214 [Termitomyces sp. Mi166|nr:hypothetical protein C0995_006214 [Termitomyces sp. Mi166\